MAWELPNKGKGKSLNKVPEPEKNFGFIWVEAYKDIYITIQEKNDSEQFERKLQIIKARIREVNRKLITLLKKIRTLWPYRAQGN